MCVHLTGTEADISDTVQPVLPKTARFLLNFRKNRPLYKMCGGKQHHLETKAKNTSVTFLINTL